MTPVQVLILGAFTIKRSTAARKWRRILAMSGLEIMRQALSLARPTLSRLQLPTELWEELGLELFHLSQYGNPLAQLLQYGAEHRWFNEKTAIPTSTSLRLLRADSRSRHHRSEE